MILLVLVIALLEQHWTDWEVCSRYLQNFWFQNLTNVIKCPGRVCRAPPKSRIPVARNRLYVCLGGTLTITRTIEDHTFGVLELCFQSHLGYEICVRGAAMPPWIMIIKSLHMFNVLGGHQRTSQPSAL